MREITVPEPIEAVDRLSLAESDARGGAAGSSAACFYCACFDGDDEG